jgi:hypothetical protein
MAGDGAAVADGDAGGLSGSGKLTSAPEAVDNCVSVPLCTAFNVGHAVWLKQVDIKFASATVCFPRNDIVEW